MSPIDNDVRQAVLGKWSLADLALKAGALGIALVGCGLLAYGMNVLYKDNKATTAQLFAIIARDHELRAATVTAIENNTRAVQMLNYRQGYPSAGSAFPPATP